MIGLQDADKSQYFAITECNLNEPRSIYQYSNMAPRLSGQTSMFVGVFFVSESLLGIERLKKIKKIAILTRKPRRHVRILIYRMWPIVLSFDQHFDFIFKSLYSLTAQEAICHFSHKRSSDYSYAWAEYYLQRSTFRRYYT